MEQLNDFIEVCCLCYVPSARTTIEIGQYIPALLHANHNTIHTAHGTTPHLAVFGWSTCDFRASLHFPCPDTSSCDLDVDEWVRTRSQALRKAEISIEHARGAIICAQKASDKPHVYAVGDLVKITKVLPLHLETSQSQNYCP
jgi:hypothetical protein